MVHADQSIYSYHGNLVMLLFMTFVTMEVRVTYMCMDSL